MISPSLLSLSILSLASLAQAVAYPQPSTTNDISSPSATFTIGNTGSTSTGMAMGVIVAIAVVIVCSVCGCCGMIWWFCARHRKNMRRIRAQNDMAPVVAQEQTRPTAPLISGQQSNIIPATGQYSGGYFDQTMGHQTGQQTGHFDPKMSPHTPSTTTITPMTTPGTPSFQYQQTQQMGNQPPVPRFPQHIHEMAANPAPPAELKG
jgi:hypothetical protein